MTYTHKNKGVCSTSVSFDIEDGKVKNVEFVGGCNGNLKAIALLSEGRTPEELIATLKGNTCGWKDTSCADQFAKGLEEAIKGEN
ncbi:MAG: TIGR03905 family TSCPD domain-containing protein [Eubacteriales bacterium]|nr:TIGR03905 family TSCPD domain-containing protein [Eubacteriales bacterium]